LPIDLDLLLQAYANGVNAWIEAHDGALPVEFLLR
jgi:acyl-homoserine lactone acylase PvdQ